MAEAPRLSSEPVSEPPEPSDRYARQARFWGVGSAGQARLRAARAAVVGCGALGAAVIDHLARGGVGHLVAVDRDVVELSNLQRQVLYDEADAAAGAPKAVAAARAIARVNAEVEVRPVIADLTAANVEAILAGAQVVIDGTDNFETRFLVNDACVKAGVPWIYGGAIGSTGMVMAVRPGETPCLRCLYPEGVAGAALATCETAGVLAPTVAVVGAVQAAEALKVLVGDPGRRQPGLLTFDVWTSEWTLAEGFERRPDCPCCVGRRFEHLEARGASRSATLCGRNAVQVSPARPMQLDLDALARRLAAAGRVVGTDYMVRLVVGPHELTVFADGRAIVKGTADAAQARSVVARYLGA
ncbi:MAG TPA: ThiF family adenylyltransferase [Anaeromyxobacteraceae bacterium]|nr:ThiF family adenylyltransferase [Anaeromyxobacteraceae bacterium]